MKYKNQFEVYLSLVILTCAISFLFNKMSFYMAIILILESYLVIFLVPSQEDIIKSLSKPKTNK